LTILDKKTGEKTMTDIIFSVVIPVLNRESDIGECIESLLNQNFPSSKFEVIIVDNGSTDDTLKVIKHYPVKCVLEKKKGPGAARNAGIRYARGEYLAFMDSDCVAEASWLNAFGRFVEKREVWLAGGLTIGYSPGSALQRFLAGEEGPVKIKYNLHRKNFVSSHNMIIKKELFNEIEGFKEEFIAGEDLDICWRAEKKTKKTGICDKAVVRHKYKKGINQLIRQRYTWGYYTGLLNERHPDKYSRIEIFLLFMKTAAIFLFILPSFLLNINNPYKRTKYFFLFFVFAPKAFGRFMYSMEKARKFFSSKRGTVL